MSLIHRQCQRCGCQTEADPECPPEDVACDSCSDLIEVADDLFRALQGGPDLITVNLIERAPFGDAVLHTVFGNISVKFAWLDDEGPAL